MYMEPPPKKTVHLSTWPDISHKKGLPVPRILAEATDQSAYLQDDLGDISLFQLIKQGRESGNFSDEETNILKQNYPPASADTV